MAFDRVEAQQVQAEGSAFSNAQNMAVENQAGAAMSTGNNSDSTSYRLPGLEVVAGQTNPASGNADKLQPGGHAVELAPPGSPFSIQMFVPDDVQPNVQEGNIQRGGAESRGTLGRRGGAESAATPGNSLGEGESRGQSRGEGVSHGTLGERRGGAESQGQSRGGGDTIRRLPDGEENPGKDELPNMKPKDKPKPLADGARELGEDLLNEAKRERIREFLRNHLRNGHRRKL